MRLALEDEQRWHIDPKAKLDQRQHGKIEGAHAHACYDQYLKTTTACPQGGYPLDNCLRQANWHHNGQSDPFKNQCQCRHPLHIVAANND